MHRGSAKIKKNPTQIISGNIRGVFLQNMYWKSGFEVQKVWLFQIWPVFSENQQSFVLFSNFLAILYSNSWNKFH